MLDSTVRITLDVRKPSESVVVSAKRGDTLRKILIDVTDGGVPYSLDATCRAVFTAAKPDGTKLYNSCSVENNRIVYAFTEQTCAAVGRLPAEIKLYSGDRLLTTASFLLDVREAVFNPGDVESTDEMNALDALYLETEALKQELLRKLENGEFNGAPGEPGAPGQDGSVVFEELTEAQRASLTGPPGEQGPQGETGPEGPQGLPGQTGKSAYQYALEAGFSGTESEFAKKLTAEYLALSGGILSGSLNMNAQALLGLRSPQESGEAATKGYVDSRTGIKQVWENVSQGSAFPSQTLSLDLSPYSRLMVCIRTTTSDGSATFVTLPVGKTTRAIATGYPSDGYFVAYRSIGCTESSVTFSNASGRVFTTTGSSAISGDTGRLIPIFIYGIR